jgi:hypothetical protein
MRVERRPVTEQDVRAAVTEVADSGLVPLLEKFVHLGRGRRRRMGLPSLLTGIYLCSQLNAGRIVLERVTDILFFRIPEELREQLGIPTYPDTDRGFEAGYAVVRRMFHAAVAAMNPSPLPANTHLSREEADRLVDEADPEVLAERADRLTSFSEFVSDASLRPLKPFFDQAGSSLPRHRRHTHPHLLARAQQQKPDSGHRPGCRLVRPRGRPPRPRRTAAGHPILGPPRPARRQEDTLQKEVPLRLRRPPAGQP